MQIKPNQTILFIGDSITDCGRRETMAPLGGGYVKFFNDFLTIRQTTKNIKVINKGIGGNTVIDLQNRWSDDVIRQKPDWLSVKIGINDIHRMLFQTPEAVPLDTFEAAYDDILARTKKHLPKCGILLIDPFYISTDTASTSFRTTVLEQVPKYIKIITAMSKKYNTLRVQTHDIFQKLLKTFEPDVFCPEPVHPNPTGHLVITEAVYNTLDK